jgi:hypothetical protein
MKGSHFLSIASVLRLFVEADYVPEAASQRMPAFTTLQSSRSLQAVAAGALEIWIFGKHYVAALLTDEPFRSLQHRSALIAQYAIWTTYDLLSHLKAPF